MSRAASAAIAPGTVLRAGDQKAGNQAVMKAAGVLDALPYRLEWKQFGAAAPLLEALNAGAVDLAAAADAPTTFALAAGTQARVVSAFRSSGAGTAIVVPGNSPIRTASDLRGRRIATNRGSIGHALVLALAERDHWAGHDLQIANLMPADAKAALSTGAVDAWSTWNSYVAQAVLVDGARVVVDGSDGLLSGLSFVSATVDCISEKPAALADFLQRLANARIWAIAHPDVYAQVIAAEIGISVPVARAAFDHELVRPVPIDAAVVADEQRTADRYLAAGLLHGRLDAAAAFDHGFTISAS